MTKASTLSSLKVSTLKTLLKSIGSRIVGTKAVQLQQLRHDVRIPKLASVGGKSTRVLSIDMGIRNLAFCVCDVETLGQREAYSAPVKLSVKAWKRIAVTAASVAPRKKKGSTTQKLNPVGKNEEVVEEDDPFSPRALSAKAYSLVKNILLPYAPDTILIERQRFRTRGTFSITEWTVRVNLFEAMLWSVLTTLKNDSLNERTAAHESNQDKFPDIWDVSPKRINRFWFASDEKVKSKEDKRAKPLKVEKKDKIELVQKWILASDDEDITIQFGDGAVHTKEAFITPKKGRVGKKIDIPLLDIAHSKSVERKEALGSIGKLDDLADCLLQAASWATWEKNRRHVLPFVEEEDVDRLYEWFGG